jgi:hypothetical protein
VKRPASLRDGELFECPMCATEFRVGGQGVTAAPGRPARGDGAAQGVTTGRRPDRRDEPEDEGEELEVVSDKGRRKRRRPSRSGTVELGRWISLGFTHWFTVLPTAVMFFILYIICYVLVSLVFGIIGGLIARAHPLIGGFITAFGILSIMVSLSAGMSLVSVQQLQGKRWSFGDFFSGSQWWMVLLLNWILLEVIYIALIIVPSAILAMVLGALKLPPLVVQGVTTAFQVLAFLCLYPLTWMFSWQLILDGNYGPLESITENVRMALPNFFRLLPVAMVTLLLRVLGVLLCGVGFAGTWPLAVLIESAAYLRLTGRHVAESPSEIN